MTYRLYIRINNGEIKYKDSGHQDDRDLSKSGRESRQRRCSKAKRSAFVILLDEKRFTFSTKLNILTDEEVKEFHDLICFTVDIPPGLFFIY